jgi:membrane protease YdiL (CAAX protease family)
MKSAARYTLLAYGITWVGVLPLVLGGLGVLTPGPPAYWHAVGAAGPVLAAFIMRRSADTGFRFRDLYRRQSAGGLGRPWSALLVATPVLLLGLALLATLAVDGSLDALAPARPLVTSAWLANLLIASVLYGFGEEPGWRGWLLPHFQRRHGPVVATVLVAVIWAAWHTPFFAYRFDFDGVGTVIGFFIGMLAGAFWLTFVFNSTGGSVLVVSLWHMAWNAANLVALPSATAVMVLNVLMVALGYGVLLVFGRRGLTVAGSVVAMPPNPLLRNT